MKKFFINLKKRKVQIAIIATFAIFVVFGLLYFQSTQVMPQAAIYFLHDVVIPKSGQKVLVYSPHPDDETIGAGGYIANAIKQGADVKIVLVTNGNAHHLQNIRYEEFKKATGILGVSSNNLVFLNYPDGKLKKQDPDKLENDLKQQLIDYSPDIVLYPHPQDKHFDHAIVGKIMQKILKDKNIISYQYLVHHQRFPQPKKFSPDAYLLPPISMINFDSQWQKYELPYQIEDQKLEAILTYKSQLRVPFLRSLILSSIRKNELFSIPK